MTSLDAIAWPPTVVEAELALVDGARGIGSVELVHLQLISRLQVARAELRRLEAGSRLPEELVARLGSVVAQRQRELEAMRAETEARVQELLAAADLRAEEIVAAAESEGRVLRAIGIWLGDVALAKAAMPSAPRANEVPGPQDAR